MQSAVHAHGPQKAAKRGVLKVGPEQLSFSVHRELKKQNRAVTKRKLPSVIDSSAANGSDKAGASGR